MILFVLAVFLAVNGIESRVSPKFLKALGGVQKALYAEKFGYSLIPIPNRILVQAKLAKPLWEVSRIGGARKHVFNYGSRRRRRRRRKKPQRRPPYYGIPTYAHRYKEYTPERRPPWTRYKKRQRYRIPYREVYAEPEEFDYYEQEIPDEYTEYEPSHSHEPEYMEYDGPNRHLSEYDSDFMSHHSDLYRDGYNPGPHRVRIYDSDSEASSPPVTRVSYQYNRQKPITRGKHNSNMYTYSIPHRPRPGGTVDVILPSRTVAMDLFRPSSSDTRHVGRDVSLQLKRTPNFSWNSGASSFSYPSNHQSKYNTNTQYYNENLSKRSEETFDDTENSEEENKRNHKNTQFDYGMENFNEEVTSFQ